MKLPFLDSYVDKGTFHFFVYPEEDNYILPTLEIVDVYEYLYRYLKCVGYDNIIFLNGHTDSLQFKITTFDDCSFYAFKNPAEFIKSLDSGKSISDTIIHMREKPQSDIQTLHLSHRNQPLKEAIPPKQGKHTFGTVNDMQQFCRILVSNCTELMKYDKARTAFICDDVILKWNMNHSNQTEVIKGFNALKDIASLSNIWIFTSISKANFAELGCYLSDIFTEFKQEENRDAFVNKLGCRYFEVGRASNDEIRNLLIKMDVCDDANINYSKLSNATEKIIDFMNKNLLPYGLKRLYGKLTENNFRFYNNEIEKDLKIDKLKNEKAIYDEIDDKLEPILIERMFRNIMPELTVTLDQALNELNNMIGLDSVKTNIIKILDLLETNKKDRELNIETKPLRLHMAFTGNPGTGKTTVARIIGKIFKAAKLLSNGHFVEISPSDMISNHVGETSLKTEAKIKDALGGVLFIDEAYGLDTGEHGFGDEAINTLVKEMENKKDDFCVIIAGYTDEINNMVKRNAGLRSRINEQFYIEFPDYSVIELVEIFKFKLKTSNFICSQDCLAEFESRLQKYLQKTDMRKAGNGRLIDNLFDNVRMSRAGRIRNSDDVNNEILAGDIEKAFETSSNRIKPDPNLLKDALERLDGLIGLDFVKKRVREIRIKIDRDEKDRELDIQVEPIRLHMAFTGNPGTGKTTVARLVGEIFKAMGILRKGHFLEISAKDLIAGYIGQTNTKTEEVLEKALGGVLFIDEAYNINDGPQGFGKQAMATLIAAMENHMDDLCVIFAGYSDLIPVLQELNPGIMSRIQNIIEFPDYSVSELVQIFNNSINNRKLKIYDEDIVLFEKLLSQYINNIDFDMSVEGNGRLIKNLFDKILAQRALRLNDNDIPSDEQRYIHADDLKNAFNLNIENITEEKPIQQKVKMANIELYSDYNDEEKNKLMLVDSLLFITVKGNNGLAYGSGFIISDDGFAITCRHVVDKASEIKARVRRTYRNGKFSDENIECDIVNSNEEYDIALLKLRKKDIYSACVLESPSAEIAIDNNVTLYSYPLGSRLSSAPTLSHSVVTSILDNGTYLTDLRALHGSSGGAVCNKYGRVIGFLPGSFTDGETDLNYFRHIELVWSLFIER